MLSAAKNKSELLDICNEMLSAKAEEEKTEDSLRREREASLRKLLPSTDALEDVVIKLLDALIKHGQIAMAKSAFNTQLEVIKKVQPEQYKKYKKIPVDQLAVEAVMQQAKLAQLQPKTGNKLIDMLHENGIPIGNSLKGLEQAIKTQREIENTDPAEQIAKAILEKVQKQILPGIVANVIAGRNPFLIGSEHKGMMNPSAEDRMPRMQHEEALNLLRRRQLKKQILAGAKISLLRIILKNYQTTLQNIYASNEENRLDI
ncbi:unnamed protein product [Thelazia callipaeda]|uniref:Uncharacterized protein n=1 Tax=Thelazia callipaeda TaxID=103827 RepID=A0A0N5CU89_THECL|nr:unnamed protein product [Thelazia callipaeda]